MVGSTDGQSQDMGLWVVLFVSAQGEVLGVEPQARVPDLLLAGTEPAYQAAQTPEATQARRVGGARGTQSYVVDGLHAGSTGGWAKVPDPQCVG